MACRIWVPWTGIEALLLKHGVLTTGSPGNSKGIIYYLKKNWNIIYLQCVNFCRTATWASRICIHICPPFWASLPPHPPLRAITERWAELPGCTAAPTSRRWAGQRQWCPPNSSHPLLPPLCPQVCLYPCPARRFIGTVFLDSIDMCQYLILIFLFLTSLCTTGSKFIYITTTDSVLLFFIAE